MPQTLTAEKTAAENKNTTAEILVKNGRKKADFEKIYFFLSPFITVLILHILQLPYHHITKETFVFFTAKVLLSCVFFGAVLFRLAFFKQTYRFLRFKFCFRVPRRRVVGYDEHNKLAPFAD